MTIIERTVASAAMLLAFFSFERKTGFVGWGLGTILAAVFVRTIRTQLDPLSELGVAMFAGYGAAALVLFLVTFVALPKVCAALKDSLGR